MTKHKALVFLCGLALTVVPNIASADVLAGQPSCWQPAELDSSAIMLFTYDGMVVFSYDDSNVVKITKAGGSLIWFDTLMEDDYVAFDSLDPGTYRIFATGGISAMTGNPFTLRGMGSWYAVDQYGRGISTKLLSVGPGISDTSIAERPIVIFAYEDSTRVVLKDLDEDKVMWEGYLDSAEYHNQDMLGNWCVPFSVEASKGVSAYTGALCVESYPSSFNGTFTGTDFMLYSQYDRGKQDLQVIPWHDSTKVVVINLDNPADTIWEVFCPRKGWVEGVCINSYGSGPRAVYIQSDKDISVSQTPWVSYSTRNAAYYLARGIDAGGLGLGKEYYLPIELSITSESCLHVIAVKDATQVTVGKIPFGVQDEVQIWQGVLNEGEYYKYMNGGDAEDFVVCHVTASDTVLTMGSSNGVRHGSDFFSGWYWEKPGPGIGEETEPVTPVPVTPVTHLDSPIGREIVVRYSDCPRGFSASVFDVSGRKVDELRSSQTSGTITWGEGHTSGVYFIRSDSDVSTVTQRVILLK